MIIVIILLRVSRGAYTLELSMYGDVSKWKTSYDVNQYQTQREGVNLVENGIHMLRVSM